MNPVFIMGFSRTGSTMLLQILNKYTNICIVPEMCIYWPFWLHTDFARNLKKYIGNVDDDKIDDLFRLFYSKKLFGAFWQNIDKIRIDIECLKKKIIESDRSIRSIFDALLYTLAKSYNKKTIGAKFPVHFFYIDKLLEWYPDCKIIHTIREPRAIYASQFYKYASEDYSRVKNLLIAIRQFVHVNFSYNCVVRFHEKMKVHHNYHLYRYEEAISNPEKSLKQLCNFLDAEFVDEMLIPRVFFNTSLAKKKISIGFHQSSINAWKTRLPRGVSGLIKVINGRGMKEIGYH